MPDTRVRAAILTLPVSMADTYTARVGDVNQLFERLFADYQAPILNYLYRLVSDAAVAEDLTQEAFTRAWHSRRTLAEVGNPRAWLYRIATNAARDHLRRARLLSWLPLKSTDRRLAVEGPEETSLEGTQMQRALAKLTPEHRIPLVLYTCQGCSVADIAAALNISADAVKQRLVRARQRLREVYQ